MHQVGRTWRLNKGFLLVVEGSVATHRDRRKGGEKQRCVNVKVPVLKDRLRERRCPE